MKRTRKTAAASPGRGAAPAKRPLRSARKPSVKAQDVAREAAQPGKREAILSAALEEFSARGFAAARLDDVAKRAGVAKGTIYLYFRDKETLFQELVRVELSPVVAVLESTQFADVPFRTVVDRLISTFEREILGTHRKDVVRLILTEGSRFPAIAEFYYHEVVERVMKALRALAQRAVERGELPNDALVRFPQLIGAPGIVAIIWTGLFDRWARIDVPAFLRAYVDLIFARRPL